MFVVVGLACLRLLLALVDFIGLGVTWSCFRQIWILGWKGPGCTFLFLNLCKL